VQRSSHSIGLPPASRTWTEGKAVSSWAGSHADDRDHDPSRSLEWSSLAEQQCTYPGDQAPCCTFQRRTASLGRGPHVLGPALGPALARVDTPSLVDTRADRLEEEEEEEARRAAPPLSAAGRFVPEGQAGASVIAGGGGHRACCCGWYLRDSARGYRRCPSNNREFPAAGGAACCSQQAVHGA
jgi:hypothetical protein